MYLGGWDVSKHHFEYKEEDKFLFVKVAVLLESMFSFPLFVVSIQIS
jgi:hypothetical protein